MSEETKDDAGTALLEEGPTAVESAMLKFVAENPPKLKKSRDRGINPKFVAALNGTHERRRAHIAALRVMSAMRGADAEDLDLKEIFCTPIRLWVLNGDHYLYGDVGYTYKVDRRSFDDGQTLEAGVKAAFRRAKQMKAQADKGPWRTTEEHYIAHVCTALAAIAYIEGWEDGEYAEYF